MYSCSIGAGGSRFGPGCLVRPLGGHFRLFVALDLVPKQDHMMTRTNRQNVHGADARLGAILVSLGLSRRLPEYR